MTPLAPIVLFTYKRLDTLIKTVEALQKNKLASDSDLFVFSDAAKAENDKQAIAEVRRFLKSIAGFKSVTISEAPQNKGLAKSIIDGVTEILKQYDSVIVLEDDLISTPNFLSFMNEGLTKYQLEENVFSISGYSFDLKQEKEYAYQTYFLNRGWSWGWATWRNRWVGIDWEMKDYDKFVNNAKAKKEFAKGGSDLNGMLAKQMSGKLDSWAIRWFYNQFKVGGLTVYPVRSKIFNDGFDQRATHTKGSAKRYIPSIDDGSNYNFKFPEEINVSSDFQSKFQYKMGYFSRIRSKIETILGI